MRLFSQLPIKQKLTFIIMLVSGVALLLACNAFLVYEHLVFRGSMAHDLATAAEMIGDNSSAALSFNDPESAAQTLESLGAHPHIVVAAIYGKEGALFARYQATDAPSIVVPPRAERGGHRFRDDGLELFHPIHLAGEQTGTVYIRSDLRELHARFRQYLLIVFAVLLVSSLAAYFLSRTLQRVISEPISHLADVARRVAGNKDYSLRATQQSEDELGHLIEGFNEMLNQIQQRDEALRAARDTLESRVEARTQELAASVSLLNATLESTPDGILALDLQGKVLCCNRQMVELWGFPPGLVERKNGDEILAHCAVLTDDPSALRRRVEILRAAPEAEHFDELALRDGRRIERLVRPQWLGQQCAGRVLSFRDVTDRKKAAAKLEAAHRQLVEASRQAGMAEVASSVLHNVGNVLNSVNVSAALVGDKLRKCKLAGLQRVVALLREHERDLGTFLIADARGQQLTAYLAQLAEHLQAEQEASLGELEGLRMNIEHIKEIVTMQQNYAKLSGLKELVQLTDLVEDSLRLNAAALARHGVKVFRHFEDLPAANVEKHKVLQILVNLVRNAKYACDESGRADKCLTVRVGQHADKIKIVVSDNGVGIPPENLTRIFNHGFTTRKDGHGFGLHSGALTAQEMGGSLVAQSDGPGRGATFTLELPREPSALAA